MGTFSHCDERKFRFIDQLQRGWREQKQAIAGQPRGATAPKLVTDFVAIYRETSVDAKSVLLVPTAAVIKSHSKAVKEVLLLVDRYKAPGERPFKPTKKHSVSVTRCPSSLPEDEVAGQAEKSADTAVAPQNAAGGPEEDSGDPGSPDGKIGASVGGVGQNGANGGHNTAGPLAAVGAVGAGLVEKRNN